MLLVYHEKLMHCHSKCHVKKVKELTKIQLIAYVGWITFSTRAKNTIMCNVLHFGMLFLYSYIDVFFYFLNPFAVDKHTVYDERLNLLNISLCM